MKREFIGFYMPTKEELVEAWKSERTIFVFDTNVLIKLYSYQAETRNDFFSVLEKLGNKIWLPHQVGLEFQHRRIEIKLQEKKKFKHIENDLESILSTKSKIEQKFMTGRFPNLDSATVELFNGIQELVEQYKKTLRECDELQPCVRTHDEIREKIDQYFTQVGREYSQEELNQLYKDGEDRYRNKIPPGFKDESKGNKEGDFFYKGINYKKKFGDLIIWRQIIDISKDNNIENVIFVTDDEKEDWWYSVQHDGKKVIGPLANLTHEIMNESKVSLFHMYNTTSFLEDAKEFTSLSIKDTSINDTEKVKLETIKEKNIKNTNIHEMIDFLKIIKKMEGYQETIYQNRKIIKEIKSIKKMEENYRKILENILLDSFLSNYSTPSDIPSKFNFYQKKLIDKNIKNLINEESGLINDEDETEE